MKALIKQKPASQKEIFYESDWLEWMDQNTGYPLNTYPYKYGLCDDAISDKPDDYNITVEKINGVKYYTATIKDDYIPNTDEIVHDQSD